MRDASQPPLSLTMSAEVEIRPHGSRSPGQDQERDGATDETEGVQQLGALLGKVHWSPPVRLSATWATAVGPVLAEHCRMIAVRRPAVIVEADSPQWKKTIQDHQAEIVARLRGAGLGSVQHLVVRVSNRRVREPPVRELGSLTHAETCRVEECLREVKTPALRAVLERLMTRAVLAERRDPPP